MVLCKDKSSKEFAKQLDFKSVKFPVHNKTYSKIEKQNNISVIVFGYEGEASFIYTSKQTFKKHVDLLYRILKIPVMT